MFPSPSFIIDPMCIIFHIIPHIKQIMKGKSNNFSWCFPCRGLYWRQTGNVLISQNNLNQENPVSYPCYSIINMKIRLDLTGQQKCWRDLKENDIHLTLKDLKDMTAKKYGELIKEIFLNLHINIELRWVAPSSEVGR